MPLHDWSKLSGWDGVHQVWIVELLYWIKPRLPAGYRAYIGTTPSFAVDAPSEERPDVKVQEWRGDEQLARQLGDPSTISAEGASDEPDQEVAVTLLDADKSLLIERHGQLVSAIELVSPRNKDRSSARTIYASGYVGYLLKGINLLLIDVHRLPLRFSFADRIAEELRLEQPPLSTPFAASYRVGEPAPGGGRLLAIWRRSLTVGGPLPTLPLPLTVHEAVTVDLEQTYTRAAAAAYLD